MPFKKGGIPWNKGLTAKTDERVEEGRRQMQATKRKLFKEGLLVPCNKGIPRSEEVKIKIGITKKRGYELGLYKSLRGVPKSADHCRRISETLKHEYALGVLKRPWWTWEKGCTPWNKGRGDYSPYTDRFYDFSYRKRILARDGYRCALCSAEENLCIHHIDKNKQNDSFDNLITLCRSCHSKMNLREYSKTYQKRLYFILNDHTLNNLLQVDDMV